MTDPDCAPESAKFVSTSRTGSNVCAWWGSYSKGKSFNYLFLGFIACLNIPITNEWVESSYECLRMHPNRLRFRYNVQECIRNLLRIKHDFSNRGIRGQVLNSSNFLIPIPDRPTNCKNWLRIVWFSCYQDLLKLSTFKPTNPNICQFVAIRGIRALCGIGV